MNVSEIMVRKPVFVELPATREDVLSALIRNKRTGMPVIDNGGKVLGTITRKDIFQNPGEQQVAVIMNWDTPTVSASTPVEKAARLMFEENQRRIPVVKKGKLVGLLTPTDLLKVIEKNKVEKPVEEYLRSQPTYIYAGTPANVAAQMMNLSKVYAMPVLDKEGRLCGLITDRDLFDLKYLGENISLTTLGISEDEDAWTWEGLRNVMNLYYQEAKIQLPSDPVSKFMTKELSTLYRRTPAHEGARVMRVNDFDQVPIVDKDDNIMNMLYDMDLLRALLD
ncbi:MAG: CBS domain-containing protein [Candidatus Thermoplasmatota archaeon]|jgi:CBS domain-containing protein|nr:CBS domain-containing protein [Candidatus Thermoplasmatota archaeon]